MVNRDTVEEFWGFKELDVLVPLNAIDGEQLFLSSFSSFLDSKGQALWFDSGREALTAALRGLPRVVGRSKVLIASFNCEAVAVAVISAGYQVKTFDFQDCFGGVDWERVAEQNITNDVCAVVIPHLFGVPSDFSGIVELARDRGVFLIEDCAHTFGGKISKGNVGSIGDCAIYSFNYDKPISLGGGGVLVVNNNNVTVSPFVPCHSGHVYLSEEKQNLILFLKTMNWRRENITSPPSRLLRVLNKLVGTQKQVKFCGLGPLRAALGIYQLARYPEIAKIRNNNAQMFMDIPHWSSWHVGANVVPKWLKQKMIPKKPVDSRALALKFQREGLRVGPFNWGRTIDKYFGWKDQHNSAYIARFGLDVPIHQNMQKDEIAYIVDTLQNV